MGSCLVQRFGRDGRQYQDVAGPEQVGKIEALGISRVVLLWVETSERLCLIMYFTSDNKHWVINEIYWTMLVE